LDQSFPNAGRALDHAAGLGRHAIWLTERAWHVSAIDVSEVALGKLLQAAGDLKVKSNFFAMDAAEYRFEPAEFDLIGLFYHLDRGLFPQIASALKPGGLFVSKMAVYWGSEISPAKASAKPLPRNEFVSLIPGLDVIDHHERPVRDRGVVEFIGRKPKSRKVNA
jgi:SAM-dependent methyltransferase